MNITGIILTKDGNIAIARKSLSFCNEVLIFKNEEIIDFAKSRNEALKHAKNEWVLFLDDDEVVSDQLAKEILKLNLEKLGLNGFYIKRRDVIWGRELKHGETGNTKLLRLARKQTGFWRRSVHEYWEIRGPVGTLNNPIYHYPHQSVNEFIKNIDYFSGLHAKENKKEGKRSSLVKIILWPKLKLVQNWILKLGFLDGTAGFVHAIIMSFHSYLAWSKQWLTERKSQ